MDAKTEAQKNEQAVFGTNPVRDVDGRPSERGMGSRWQGLPAADRVHYLAVQSRDAVEALIAQAQALSAAAAKVAETHKEFVAEAQKAKETAAPEAAVGRERAETERRRVEQEKAEKEKQGERERAGM